MYYCVGNCGRYWKVVLSHYVEHVSLQPGKLWAAVACGVFQYHKTETPMIAICRAVVSAKLGDEVEIPDELIEVKG